jgi:hypothetical protein
MLTHADLFLNGPSAGIEYIFEILIWSSNIGFVWSLYYLLWVRRLWLVSFVIGVTTIISTFYHACYTYHPNIPGVCFPFDSKPQYYNFFDHFVFAIAIIIILNYLNPALQHPFTHDHITFTVADNIEDPENTDIVTNDNRPIGLAIENHIESHAIKIHRKYHPKYAHGHTRYTHPALNIMIILVGMLIYCVIHMSYDFQMITEENFWAELWIVSYSFTIWFIGMLYYFITYGYKGWIIIDYWHILNKRLRMTTMFLPGCFIIGMELVGMSIVFFNPSLYRYLHFVWHIFEWTGFTLIFGSLRE